MGFQNTLSPRSVGNAPSTSPQFAQSMQPYPDRRPSTFDGISWFGLHGLWEIIRVLRSVVVASKGACYPCFRELPTNRRTLVRLCGPFDTTVAGDPAVAVRLHIQGNRLFRRNLIVHSHPSRHFSMIENPFMAVRFAIPVPCESMVVPHPGRNVILILRRL